MEYITYWFIFLVVIYGAQLTKECVCLSVRLLFWLQGERVYEFAQVVCVRNAVGDNRLGWTEKPGGIRSQVLNRISSPCAPKS